MRARIGPLVAEIAAEDADRLALAPGRIVTATWSPADTRVVPLNGNIPGTTPHDGGT